MVCFKAIANVSVTDSIHELIQSTILSELDIMMLLHHQAIVYILGEMTIDFIKSNLKGIATQERNQAFVYLNYLRFRFNIILILF